MGELQKLTKTEQEVLDLILSNEYTVKQIANRRGTSDKLVYKHIQNLIKKGLKLNLKTVGLKKGGVVSTKVEKSQKNVWRYHALQFDIKPYYFYPRYEKFRKKKGNRCFTYSNWRVALYKSKIVMWLKAGIDFKNKDRQRAIELAEHSFEKTLNEIANRYGFEYAKNKHMNIKLVKHHLAYTNPAEFDTITKDKVFVSFRGDDGKIFLQYDRSKGFKEREYVHPDTCTEDAETMERHFKVMGDPKIMTLEEIQGKIGEVIQLLGNSIRGQEINTMMLNKMIKLFTPEQPTDKEKSEQKCILQYIG